MTQKVKIAIISDTHDNLATLQKAIEWINKNGIEEIIHCGDVCSSNTLQWLTENFPGVKPRGGHAALRGKIHLALGNVDDSQTTMAKIAAENSNITLCGESGEIKINNKRIAFCHHPKSARELASTGQYDIVFFGHTHRPWEEKIGECRLINPGNLSNMLYKATFAVYDTASDKLELKVLEQL